MEHVESWVWSENHTLRYCCGRELVFTSDILYIDMLLLALLSSFSSFLSRLFTHYDLFFPSKGYIIFYLA